MTRASSTRRRLLLTAPAPGAAPASLPGPHRSGPGGAVLATDGGDRDGDRDDRDGDRDRTSVELPDGTRIERSGDRTGVRCRDGWTEAISGDRYELRDRRDRQVVERQATARDRARVARMAGR